jgi:catechol 2,3-dioxygenase-like lactoylglutathione lyase family enzyme
MEIVISQLLRQFEDGKVTRRQLIRSLALAAGAAAGGSVAAAQSGGLRTLHVDHVNYLSSDYRRTRDFYAGLMGMTVENDNGTDACELHFGDARGVGVRDRAMMSVRNLRPAAAGGTPERTGVDHIALRVADWNTDRVRAELERRSLAPRLAAGGAIDTPNYVSFMVQDPDGLGVQISGIAAPGDALYKGE